MVHFSGFARKMNHLLMPARAKRAQDTLTKSPLLRLMRIPHNVLLLHQSFEPFF
ncbi:MAG: hypothetical protein U5L45_08860 [Saprospiraceae bacterium]|nr:hypothetical protein [Saprospiraceae bacterium]